MMGSNENENLSIKEKVNALRKLGVSEAGIKNVQRLAALPHFFSYEEHGVLNNYSPVDGSPVVPHAPSREESNKRATNRTYRLEAEKRYEDYCSHMGEGFHHPTGEE